MTPAFWSPTGTQRRGRTRCGPSSLAAPGAVRSWTPATAGWRTSPGIGARSATARSIVRWPPAEPALQVLQFATDRRGPRVLRPPPQMRGGLHQVADDPEDHAAAASVPYVRRIASARRRFSRDAANDILRWEAPRLPKVSPGVVMRPRCNSRPATSWG